MTGFFQLRERGTSIRTEVVAGLTTFAAMAYVLAVHPTILSATGMDRAELVTVTALAAGTMSMLMGLMSNYPIAVAPQMGTNAFFAYGICLGMGIPWQGALGLVFYSGLLFIGVSVTGLRQKVINLFPLHLKAAMSVGIGLFIMGVGLKMTGLLAGQPAPVFIGLGSVASWSSGLVFAGLVLAIALIVRRVPGAILISMILVTVAGLFLPGAEGEPITRRPEAIVGSPAGLGSLWLALDLGYLWRNFGSAFPVVMTLVFIDFFSSAAAI
ncbi:MAG: NCS2 family permease, partial [Verrucomicrobiia bacterium]